MRSRPLVVRHWLCGPIAWLALAPMGQLITAANAAADAPSAIVRYSDLDFASDAGAQHLLRRIESAAHTVCFDQDVEPLALHQLARRCYLAAVARAVDTIGASRVTAAYVARYGPKAQSPDARGGQVLSVQPIKRG